MSTNKPAGASMATEAAPEEHPPCAARCDGGGPTLKANRAEQDHAFGSIDDCPKRVGHRIRRLKHAIDGLRFKLEGLALLGDMLGERLEETSAHLTRSCRIEDGVCQEADCPLAKGAAELEDAFDQVARRVEALRQAAESARQLVQRASA